MTRLVALFMLAFGWFALAVPGVAAQEKVPAEVGARIRLTVLPGRDRIIGTYLGRTGDSVAIEPEVGGPGALARSIALNGIEGVELSRGRDHPVGQTLFFGAAIGAGFGALAGLLDEPCPPTGFCSGATVAEGAAVGALFGGLVGVVVGAIGREGWTPATIAGWQPSVTPTVAGIRVGWRIPIRP